MAQKTWALELSDLVQLLTTKAGDRTSSSQEYPPYMWAVHSREANCLSYTKTKFLSNIMTIGAHSFRLVWTISTYITKRFEVYSNLYWWLLQEMWVFFLVTKDETFTSFQQFQHMVEKQTSLVISCQRTDHGSKYLSTNFSNYSAEQGIQRHLTNAHTPQQNGVAERKNRHLYETMRTLLFGANLPTNLWEEALRTANYISNHMPHRALHKTTPFERYSGNKPNVSYLRVHGCRGHEGMDMRK